MCLLYSILYGCGGPRGSSGCAGYAQGARSDTYETGGYCANAEARRCGCRCCRACSGFGRHGDEGVCFDECYYRRQYALCGCDENCSAARTAGGCTQCRGMYGYTET